MKVTGDGTIAFVGIKGGYGNVIVVSHPGHFMTIYGHLSRFAKSIYCGKRVSQGDLIGYVGMTGWATGPHLHYEFRFNGVQRDPLIAALPNAPSIPKKERTNFENTYQKLSLQLNTSEKTTVALLD